MTFVFGRDLFGTQGSICVLQISLLTVCSVCLQRFHIFIATHCQRLLQRQRCRTTFLDKIEVHTYLYVIKCKCKLLYCSCSCCYAHLGVFQLYKCF